MGRHAPVKDQSWESILLICLDTFMLLAVMGITLGVVFMVINAEIPKTKDDVATRWGGGESERSMPIDRVYYLEVIPGIDGELIPGANYLPAPLSSAAFLRVLAGELWRSKLPVRLAGTPSTGVQPSLEVYVDTTLAGVDEVLANPRRVSRLVYQADPAGEELGLTLSVRWRDGMYSLEREGKFTDGKYDGHPYWRFVWSLREQ